MQCWRHAQRCVPLADKKTLVLPKVEHIDDLAFVDARARDPLSLVLSVESASSLLSLPDILQRARELSRVSVSAVLFASEDYCAATGVRRTRSRKGLLYPRATLATIAQAYGVDAIDMVCIEYRNAAYLAEECAEGAELGFRGKQAIHPVQLEEIHTAFSPSEEGACHTDRC